MLTNADKQYSGNQRKILWLCILLTPLIGIGFDLYTPSLPAITSYFNISHFSAKLTIIFYMAGFGITQPFVGIICDRIERKKFLLSILGVYFLTAMISPLSPSITALYSLRIMNSICAASLSIIIKSLLVDHFSGKKLEKSINYFTLSWTATPMFAPVIGGYLQYYYNWQSNFYFMGAYAFILFSVTLFLFEKNSEAIHKKIYPLASILEKWKILLLDKLFIASVLILSIENAILFIYYTVAPFIIQGALHFTAKKYGEIMLFAGASYALGNILNDRLLNYFDAKKLIGIGLIASFLILFFSLIFMHFLVDISIYMATLPFFLIFLCDGLIFSNVGACLLPRYSQFSGMASGLLGGLLNSIAAGIVAFCTHWLDLHQIKTLITLYLALIMFSLVIFIFYRAEDERRI